MPLYIHRDQRLLFVYFPNGRLLSLHGSGEAVTRYLLKTPIIPDLYPMSFPTAEEQCYLWAGTLVEEWEPGADESPIRYWPGVLQAIPSQSVIDAFLSFEDRMTGHAILLAAYRASLTVSF